ncbi:hypothetical protein T03_553 [Trichinella britovi]|uniref:Uncharacterized protein n=1 Tax=Trichinella britovi TaxID=45882 RepID=A0A0V1CTL7_TRIBR|nr:hypothetical protein T03_553 [Trichinella britovi]
MLLPSAFLLFSLFPLHAGTWPAIQDLSPSAELLGRNESSSLGPGPPEMIPALQHNCSLEVANNSLRLKDNP